MSSLGFHLYVHVIGIRNGSAGGATASPLFSVTSFSRALIPGLVHPNQITIGCLKVGIVGRAKRAPHWGVQSRFRVIYIYVGLYVYVCQINCVGEITWTKHAHAQS